MQRGSRRVSSACLHPSVWVRLLRSVTVGVRPLGDGCSLFGVVGRDKPLPGGRAVAHKVVSYERGKQKQPNNAHGEGS